MPEVRAPWLIGYGVSQTTFIFLLVVVSPAVLRSLVSRATVRTYAIS